MTAHATWETKDRPFSGDRTGQDKPLRLLTWFYRKLGPRYPGLFLTLELQTAFIIAAATLGLLSFYYNASLGDYAKLVAIGMALTCAGTTLALVRTYPHLKPITRWIEGERDEE